MTTGVEICMVVQDSIAALGLYEKIFEVERVEVSDLGRGMSEVVFSIYGFRFHLLDENPAHMLIAPKEGDPKPMWVNVAVPDIQKTYDNAMAVGCMQIAPITEIPNMGLKNAMFADEFGYFWMLHQIDKIVSHEERMEMFKKSMEINE
ncbi:MAG: VOC family protein [Clostridiales bacterium]|jgi:PhnB protein|nr:VOC family protein [Clostridiales bacterium]